MEMADQRIRALFTINMGTKVHVTMSVYREKMLGKRRRRTRRRRRKVPLTLF